jgi:hypothetical protein
MSYVKICIVNFQNLFSTLSHALLLVIVRGNLGNVDPVDMFSLVVRPLGNLGVTFHIFTLLRRRKFVAVKMVYSFFIQNHRICYFMNVSEQSPLCS